MNSLFRFIVVIFAMITLPSCIGDRSQQGSPELPITGGTQVAIHITGGIAGLNDTIQISDHWQLSSMGRNHGWVRKLDVYEQKQLVRALQEFGSLHNESDGGDGLTDQIDTLVVAKGTGEGTGSAEDAEMLAELVKKFIGAKRIASR